MLRRNPSLEYARRLLDCARSFLYELEHLTGEKCTISDLPIAATSSHGKLVFCASLGLACQASIDDSTAMNAQPAIVSSSDNVINSVKIGSQGPTVVLLHGWGRSLEVLRPVGEMLAASTRVILIDLPGFGLSPLPHEASNDGGGWDTAQYAERVKRFLDESGVQSCILVGHSFGGRLSVQLASRYPQLAQALVLIGAHGLKRKRPPAQQVKLKLIRTLGTCAKKIDGLFGTRVFAHYFAPKFGSADYQAAGALRKTLVKTVNEDLSDLAATIQVPTLLLWGERDTETPLDLAHSYRSLITDSELHIFTQKGHEPFSDVGSHLVVRYIENFLKKRGLIA